MELSEDVYTFVFICFKSNAGWSEFRVRKMSLPRMFGDDGKFCTRIQLHLQAFVFDVELNDDGFSGPTQFIFFVFAVSRYILRFCIVVCDRPFSSDTVGRYVPFFDNGCMLHRQIGIWVHHGSYDRIGSKIFAGADWSRLFCDRGELAKLSAQLLLSP